MAYSKTIGVGKHRTPQYKVKQAMPEPSSVKMPKISAGVLFAVLLLGTMLLRRTHRLPRRALWHIPGKGTTIHQETHYECSQTSNPGARSAATKAGRRELRLGPHLRNPQTRP